MSDPTDPTLNVCAVGQPDPVPDPEPKLVLTVAQLVKLAPATPQSLLEKRLPGVQRMLDLSGTNTVKRARGPLARVSTETGGYRLVKEEASDWTGPHFENYLGKHGNLTLEDCLAYCGHDLLQITFKDEFAACTAWARTKGYDVDFVAHPELLLDEPYLGIGSAWYIITHPGIIAAAEAGDIDEISCEVNAGEPKAIWSAHHGLIDAKEAKAINLANGWGPKDPQYRHGIFGLDETRQHFAVANQVLLA